MVTEATILFQKNLDKANMGLEIIRRQLKDIDVLTQTIQDNLDIKSSLVKEFYDPSLTAFEIGINQARRNRAMGEQPNSKKTNYTHYKAILESLNIPCLDF